MTPEIISTSLVHPSPHPRFLQHHDALTTPSPIIERVIAVATDRLLESANRLLEHANKVLCDYED